jgi:hypothetical protein
MPPTHKMNKRPLNYGIVQFSGLLLLAATLIGTGVALLVVVIRGLSGLPLTAGKIVALGTAAAMCAGLVVVGLLIIRTAFRRAT